ncbi:hypothetical protein [Saccharopolyspora cebuensis]|uniref:hypothetical protein n=1 Tax=Saccharopolyspora cebuensis TaxID=418759 RepID=UPI0031E8ACE5
MPRAVQRISGVVPVSHHQFFLLGADGHPEDSAVLSFRENGLTATALGVIAVQTGIHTGPAHLVVEHLDGPPPPDLSAWEDAVEVPFTAPLGKLRVGALMDDPDPALRPTISIGSGDCRCRIHATGRDSAVDLAVDEPVERYLIQLWGVDVATPGEILKAESRYGSVAGPHAPR